MRTILTLWYNLYMVQIDEEFKSNDVDKNVTYYDVVVIGGGAAGLSGAMVLARANLKVLVIDNNRQSNLVSHAAHAVFTRDKTNPNELYKIAREQLLAYPTVEIFNDTVVKINQDEIFSFILKSGIEITSKYVLFAQGVDYKLPDIQGVKALFGTKIWHCPFCEGYEANDKKILVIVDDEKRPHIQSLLPLWSKRLSYIKPEELLSVEDKADGLIAKYVAGQEEYFDAALVQTTPTQRDSLAEQLGCEKTETGHIKVDEMNMTTIENVFSAGDQSSMFQQVNLAVAAGHIAGVAIVRLITISSQTG